MRIHWSDFIETIHLQISLNSNFSRAGKKKKGFELHTVLSGWPKTGPGVGGRHGATPWHSSHCSLLFGCTATPVYGSYYVPDSGIFPRRRATWIELRSNRWPSWSKKNPSTLDHAWQFTKVCFPLRANGALGS